MRDRVRCRGRRLPGVARQSTSHSISRISATAIHTRAAPPSAPRGTPRRCVAIAGSAPPKWSMPGRRARRRSPRPPSPRSSSAGRPSTRWCFPTTSSPSARCSRRSAAASRCPAGWRSSGSAGSISGATRCRHSPRSPPAPRDRRPCRRADPRPDRGARRAARPRRSRLRADRAREHSDPRDAGRRLSRRARRPDPAKGRGLEFSALTPSLGHEVFKTAARATVTPARPAADVMPRARQKT